ncbi:MAG: hypothetical protein ACI9UR_002358 [Bacteroidia bacterium]|jgi:hypothetical protein
MNYSLDDWMPEEPDFNLFHIHSHIKDYRICWALNEEFRCKMVRVDDFLEEEEKPELATYSQFYWKDEIMHREFYLICNKPTNGSSVAKPGEMFAAESREMLIPELSKVDYFLQVYGQYSGSDLDEIENDLNMMSLVNAAKLVDPSSAKFYLNLMH